MSRDQNAGRSHNTKTDNTSFESGKQFEYLGTALANQSSFQEDIKIRRNSDKACCHSVQEIMSSGALFKNLKIKIY